MSSGKEDKRRFQRLKTQVKVKVSFPDKEDGTKVTRDSISKNLSRSGVLITSTVPLDVGTFVIASFHLPDSSKPVDLFAKVVRVEEVSRDLYDVGLTFTSFTRESIEKLKGYLIEEIKRG